MTISQAAGNVCTVSALNTKKHQTTNSVESEVIYLPSTDCVIKSQASLSAFTSYRVGWAADLYVAPRNLEALQASLKYAKERD